MVTLLLVAAPARGADVAVDPERLPLGARPVLPYVDQATRTIVDGSRRVGFAGLVGSPRWFLKVKAGYLLDRGRDDVVLVTSGGSRRVLTARHTSGDPGSPGVAVSRDGTRVALVISDPATDGSATYRETRVLDIATGRVLARRVLPTTAGRVPVAFGTERVLLESGWWSYRTGRVERFDRSVVSAHLASWRGVGRHPGTGSAVATFDLPPDPGGPTIVEPGNGRRTFSLDGSRLAGPGATDEGAGSTDRIVVHDGADGTVEFQVTGVEAVPVVTWEDATTILFLARSSTGGPDALVRCGLAGDCERAGPLEPGDVEGPAREDYRLLTVTRRDG